MQRFARVLSLLALVALPGVAAAQKLEPGKWTGVVIDPSGNRNETVYDVTVKGDTIRISVTAPQHGTFEFSDVKLVDQTLTFWFEPGVRVECKLNRRDDGGFEGSCTDAGGGVAQMLMLPPKKG